MYQFILIPGNTEEESQDNAENYPDIECTHWGCKAATYADLLVFVVEKEDETDKIISISLH